MRPGGATLFDAVVGGLAVLTGFLFLAHESGRLDLVASERVILLVACPALSSAVWLLHRRLRDRPGRRPNRS